MYLLTGVLGLILAVAPFAFGFNDNPSALWTSIGVGVVLMVVSGMDWLTEDRGNWEYWVAGGAGFSAIVAPFILGFSGLVAAVWTLGIVGLATVIAASVKLFSGKTHYGY